MAVWAVGDIQGCWYLERLLKFINFNKRRRIIINWGWAFGGFKVKIRGLELGFPWRVP